MLHSNFKLRFSERSVNVVRGSFFQFSVVLEVWLPGVMINLKVGNLKRRNVALAEQRRESGVTQELQTKIF